MPRNGSGVFSLPAGSVVANGDTSDASDINTPLDDIVSDLNAARPITSGGTAATTVGGAQTNLKIPPFDGAANISGTWEWQDDVQAVFGNDADASISWVSADSALALKVGATARIEATATGADVTGDMTVSNDLAVTGETETGTFGTTAVAQIDLRAKLTLATKQATTSGPTVTFSSIPSGTKEIHIMFNGVSTGGADNFLVQLGDSGGIENTGYVSGSSDQASGTGSTSGFAILRTNSSTVTSGVMTLLLLDAATFTWVSTHSMGAGGETASGGGSKALSAELTQIQIGMTGSNNFDAGEISVSYR